ncbi:F-box/FBD/LRR-repeat protein At1g13570 [Nicotiana tabacum]|uniref:F-box/FBD/LRR-repeat protein At1g13570 n=2 Tax=Nicotiana tabacum TaxID=4097 RepID=A0AC58UHX0_TOBAC
MPLVSNSLSLEETQKSICFKNTPMLEKVAVYLRSRVLPDSSPGCSNLMKFFHCIPSLQELEIRGSLWEYLTVGGLPHNPPTALNNVKSLKMADMSFGDLKEVSVAVYLITSCPKLQQLTIKCESVNNVVEAVVQFLQDQTCSGGVVKLLQSVEMSHFTGTKMEMQFVRFILASAPLLKEIFIWNFSYILQSGRQMINEMKQYRRASPYVEFKFEAVEVE